MAKQVLGANDIHTETWKRIKAHLEERLVTLRKRNDSSLSLEETARLRGQIAEVKNFLNLDKPDPEIVDAG